MSGFVIKRCPLPLKLDHLPSDLARRQRGRLRIDYRRREPFDGNRVLPGPLSPIIVSVVDPEALRVSSTERLVLRVPVRADLEWLFGLYSDPRVWEPDPLTRHEAPAQTERMIGNWRAAWDRDGLGIWTAWDSNEFVGIGGCFVRYGVAWNLGFRLRPPCWGRGYAQEISTAAIRAARRRRAELPVTAYLLEGNDRSLRAVERTGLSRVWRGPDAGNPDATAIRLLYGDQPLPPTVLRALTEH
jgi:RimJ/RimL family protein N-acetyltransferase